MPQYIYEGDEELVFPTIGVEVKKGDTFDAPEGFTATGVSLVSGKSAPAESKKSHPAYKEKAKDGDGDGFVQDGTPFERPVEEKVEEPSASSDISAGA